VSLPEETDVFIANKIIDQLRNLLHRKLMEERGRIQMLYNQMKHDKRRESHGELSSSGDESQKEEEEEEEDITGQASMFMEDIRLAVKLRVEAMSKLRAEARAKHQAETGLESSKGN
jgi:hypothetical protein